MYLQYESKPKRLKIVYLPPAIVVGFEKPRFPNSDLSFFRWCFSEDNNRASSGSFSEKLYNSGFHQTTLPLATMLSSWWNVLLNRSGSEMVEDVVKVLDHIMK